MKLSALPNPLPRSLEMDIHMLLVNSDYSGVYISFNESDMSKISDTWQLLAKAKVTFEIGDVDIPGIQIETLKKQKQQILADAHVRAEQIEQQIQSLLAIEYQPETDGAA